MRRKKYFVDDYLGRQIGNRNIIEDLGSNDVGQAIIKWACAKCGNEGVAKLNRLLETAPGRCVKCPKKEYRFSGSHIAQIKQSAERRNKSFNITVDNCVAQFEKQAGLCYFTGDSLIDNCSVDRYDNDRGYEPDNIVMVTKEINRMKSTMTAEEFVDLCRKVSNNNVV